MRAVEVELLMKGNLSQGMLDAQTKAVGKEKAQSFLWTGLRMNSSKCL